MLSILFDKMIKKCKILTLFRGKFMTLTYLTFFCFFFSIIEYFPYLISIDYIVNAKYVLLSNFIFSVFFVVLSLITCSFIYRKSYLKFNEKRYRRLSFTFVFFINLSLCFFLIELYKNIFIDSNIKNISEDIVESCILTTVSTLALVITEYSRYVSIIKENEYQCKLNILKYQLNPHFLCNSLNILSGMIEKKPVMAEKYVIKISRIFRFMSNNMDKSLIDIKEALDFFKTYMSMLQLIYTDKLSYNIYTNDINPNGYLPTMAVQVVTENAVKYNKPTNNNKLIIDLSISENSISISNNILTPQYFRKPLFSSGVGLVNLFEQYKLQSDAMPTIKKNDNIFSVTLPLLKNRNKSFI